MSIVMTVVGFFTGSKWGLYILIGAAVVGVVTLLLMRMTAQAEALGKSIERLDILKENLNVAKAAERAAAGVGTDRASLSERLCRGQF